MPVATGAAVEGVAGEVGAVVEGMPVGVPVGCRAGTAAGMPASSVEIKCLSE